MTRFYLGPVLALMALPSALGHMAVWGDYVYEQGTGDDIFNPLNSERSFDEWWFHGKASDSPSGILSLRAGGTATLDIACRKEHSALGNPTDDACPQDPGAYHAGASTCPEGNTSCQNGWSNSKEENLMGCAIAIAYKPTAAQTQPEDFTVISVQPECVRQRLTSFEIPANLPACPEGGCTCAWFWSGYNSADEMYMTGFRCDVEGGVIVDTSSLPTAAEPHKDTDKSSGPMQPIYWAVTLNNIGFHPAGLDQKPRYDELYGWTAGAQDAAFASVAGSNPGAQSIANSTNNVVDPADPAAAAAVPIESGSAPDASITVEGQPDSSETGAAPGREGPAGTEAAGAPTDAAPAAAPTGLDDDGAAIGGQPPAGTVSFGEYDTATDAVALPSATGGIPDGPVGSEAGAPGPAPTGFPGNPADADADPNTGAGAPTVMVPPAKNGNGRPTGSAGCAGGGRGGGHRWGNWGPDQAQQTGGDYVGAEKRARHMERRSRRRQARV